MFPEVDKDAINIVIVIAKLGSFEQVSVDLFPFTANLLLVKHGEVA